MGKPTLSDRQLEAFHNAGYSSYQISKFAGCSAKAVRDHLKAQGVTMHKKGHRGGRLTNKAANQLLKGKAPVKKIVKSRTFKGRAKTNMTPEQMAQVYTAGLNLRQVGQLAGGVSAEYVRKKISGLCQLRPRGTSVVHIAVPHNLSQPFKELAQEYGGTPL